MSRSTASVVSTLSGCVANSHQTVHLVSSTPSKIPYGGFSPVRLQTSLGRSHLHKPIRSLIGCHCSASPSSAFYPHPSGPRLLSRTAGPVALDSPTGYIVRSDLCLLRPHLRLCRPPAGLWIIPSGRGTNPPAAEGPQFTLPVLFTPCRCPYSGGPNDCTRRCLRRWFCLRPISTGSATTCPTIPVQVGSVIEAAAFALCYGLEMLLALLRPGLLLPSLLEPGHPGNSSRL